MPVPWSVVPAGVFQVCLGAIGFLVLTFAPGAWIGFGVLPRGIPFWARLFTGAVLSPLVVCAEFFPLRLAGLPFGTVATLLVAINAPALFLVWRSRPGVHRPARQACVIAAIAVLISVASMAEVFIYRDARVYSPHAFVYADPVYMMAKGDLVLEDPLLAGARLDYPVWSGLVFQAVGSRLLNSPPITNYVWGNLLWLILIYGFAAGVAAEMGGGAVAQACAGIWLFAGTNPVGYLLKLAAGSHWVRYRLWGDPRYTPWVSKFNLFSTMPIGLGMLMAMVYLMVRPGPLTRRLLLTHGLLTAGIGLLYPLLLPPAFGLLGAKAVALLIVEPKQSRSIPWRSLAALGCLVVFAGLVTYLQVRFLIADKHPVTAAVQLSAISNAVRKIFVSLLATCLFLVSLALTWRSSWKSRPAATVTLLLGALASYFLHAAFYIPYWDNEYKFIFAVAMCLAVFPSLAVERIWRHWPRSKAIPVLAGTAAVMVAGYALKTAREWHSTRLLDRTLIETSDFHARLNPRNPWSRICNAVRLMTPPDSVLLVANGSFYYPLLTSRSLYVPARNAAYPGVTLYADTLVAEIRGNGYAVVNRRRSELADVFDSADPSRRLQALERIRSLRRPVALILEPRQHALLAWLQSCGMGRPVWAESGLTLWLIPSQSGIGRPIKPVTSTPAGLRNAGLSS